jgi:hypothetical protein
MNNIVICFPGGAGGHFITGICRYLLNTEKLKLSKSGDAHSAQSPTQSPLYLEGRLLDLSVNSYQQELELIDALGDVDIITTHFRNLLALVKQNKKVIYITVSDEDRHILYKRIKIKVPVTVSELHYNAIAGSEWPSYAEYINGNIVDELKPDYQYDWMKDWYYIMPQTTYDNLYEIKFSDILNGTLNIDKLSEFLNVTNFDKEYLDAIIKEYIELNK